MPNLHEYPINFSWTGGRGGHGSATAEGSGTQFSLAVGPEYQGPGGGTNPEELLSAAIASCYTITFGIIAENRKLPITGFDVKATGYVEQNGPSVVFKSITIRPTITATSEATDEQIAAIADMAHKADNYCLVTNAVRGKVEVTVEPTVLRA
jgi:peroxiredoxin-like protein